MRYSFKQYNPELDTTMISIYEGTPEEIAELVSLLADDEEEN